MKMREPTAISSLSLTGRCLEFNLRAHQLHAVELVQYSTITMRCTTLQVSWFLSVETQHFKQKNRDSQTMISRKRDREIQKDELTLDAKTHLRILPSPATWSHDRGTDLFTSKREAPR